MSSEQHSDKEYLSRDQVQDRLLQILLYFDGYCKEHGLRYWIAAGTLLGAVRHKGFIPWDDDVDVMMPRSDFEKLMTSFNDPGNRFFLTDWNNSPISNPFPKLCDRQVFLESWGYEGVCDENLWVDIFPVDGAPDSFSEYQRWKKADRRLLYIAWAQTRKSQRLISKVAKKVVKPISKIFITYQKCMELINNRWKKIPFDESRFATCVGCDLNAKGYSYFPRECFNGSEQVEFCSHLLPAPKDYRKILEVTYGDYLSLPPEEERVDHGTKVWLA